MAKIKVVVREVIHVEQEMVIERESPELLDEGDLIDDYVWRKDHGYFDGEGSMSSDVEIVSVEVIPSGG